MVQNKPPPPPPKLTLTRAGPKINLVEFLAVCPSLQDFHAEVNRFCESALQEVQIGENPILLTENTSGYDDDGVVSLYVLYHSQESDEAYAARLAGYAARLEQKRRQRSQKVLQNKSDIQARLQDLEEERARLIARLNREG